MENKSNKELAVELYCAFLQSSAITFSNSNESLKLPTVSNMVDTVEAIQYALAKLPND